MVDAPGRGDVYPGLSWEETIPWLKGLTSMKIIVKVPPFVRPQV
jgi:hypothetical protein